MSLRSSCGVAHLDLIPEVSSLLGADSVTITVDGISLSTSAWTYALLPVLRCIPCQGDRPVVPLAGGMYRCSACGSLYDPSEAADAD